MDDSLYLFRQNVFLKAHMAQLSHPFHVIKNLRDRQDGVKIPESLAKLDPENLKTTLDCLMEEANSTLKSIDEADQLLTQTIGLVTPSIPFTEF